MPHDPQVRHDSQREAAARRREWRIAALAERQYGVVARSQLLEMGFGPGAIDARIGRGRLRPIHRGVFAVGHRLLTAEARWMAAVLAGGSDAALSFRAAGAHWGLGTSEGGRVDVSVPRRRSPRPGIRFHETALADDEVTVHERVRITTAARTLIDLAAVLDREHLEQAIAKAEKLGLVGSPSLPELMERCPRRRGIANLRRILGEPGAGGGLTRSELEIRFLALLRRHDLPRPEINARLELGPRTLEVDCLWRTARLVAELDSRRHHLDALAFEGDRARDRALVAAGWRCLRITWRQLHDQPELVAADIRSALSARAAASR